MKDQFDRHIANIRTLIELYGITNAISAIKEAFELELESDTSEDKKKRIEAVLNGLERIYQEVEK